MIKIFFLARPTGNLTASGGAMGAQPPVGNYIYLGLFADTDKISNI